MAKTKNELHDSKFALSAVQGHIAIFGKPPKAYAYDRGGWSERNVAELKKHGGKEVGLAPRGKAEWEVSATTKKRLVSERAQVEGGIGTVKHRKYGFNRPAARSAKMMGFCGQSAVPGFNLSYPFDSARLPHLPTGPCLAVRQVHTFLMESPSPQGAT